MLVLSRRESETLVLPGLETTIQVVSIKRGVVRLGITAPEHVRILRGEIPDRDSEWAEKPTPPTKPTRLPAATPGLNKLVEKRLAIVRLGLDEVQRSMSAAQPEEAELLLDKLDEELHLLRRRLHSESVSQPAARLLRRGCGCGRDLLEDTDDCQCLADRPPAN
jgi:carbon storage regulator CsrA